MDVGLGLTIATVAIGLAGLFLLSSEWLQPLLADRRRSHLFAAEALVKRLMLRGSPEAQEAARSGIVPYSHGLETYHLTTVIETMQRADITRDEIRRLTAMVQRGTPLGARRKRETASLQDLIGSLIGLLHQADFAERFPAPRKYGRLILGTALTAGAIALAVPMYVISAQQQAADRAAIDRLVGAVIPAASGAQLTEWLRQSPATIDIIFVPMLGDGYARQLRDIFAAGGWHVTVQQSIFSSDDPAAVAVVLNLESPADASHVAQAFDTLSIPYALRTDVGATKVQELDLTVPSRI